MGIYSLVFPLAPGDPPAWGTLFATLGTTVNDGITAILPLVLVVFGTLALVGIGMRLFGKAGVKR